MTFFKIALLLSLVSVGTVNALIIIPALPVIKNFFHLENSSLEWTVSIFLFGYVIGQLIYGPISDSIGRFKTIRLGLVINLVGLILCLIGFYFVNYSILLTGRLIAALGGAASFVCVIILINEYFGTKAKHILAFALISTTIASSISVLIGGVITQYLGFEFIFLFSIIYVLIMLGVTVLFKKTNNYKIPINIKIIFLSYYHSIVNDHKIVKFAIITSIAPASVYVFNAAAPLITNSSFNMSAATYGYWNFMNFTGMLGSAFLANYLLKIFDVKKVIYIAVAIIFLCLISFSLIYITAYYSTLWFFTTSTIFFLMSGIIFPAGMFLAINKAKNKAIASSLATFITLGISTVDVIIIGEFSTKYYLPGFILIMFALLLVSFIILIFKKK